MRQDRDGISEQQMGLKQMGWQLYQRPTRSGLVLQGAAVMLLLRPRDDGPASERLLIAG
jgi:hypothetical protein